MLEAFNKALKVGIPDSFKSFLPSVGQKYSYQWLPKRYITFQELGDVENWSRVIEADMTAIASALEYAYKGIMS